MRRLVVLVALVTVALAAPADALTQGTEILVPAGFRGAGAAGSQWITTLYIQNPGTTTATVDVQLLQRNAANPSPDVETFDILPGETAVLDDVIQTLFGRATFQAAFRIVSDQPVVVNGAILNVAGGQEFAQSFEGVPVGLATTSAADSIVVGLKNNADYRTNVYLIDATGAGSTVTLELLDPSGSAVATTQLTLGAWEPQLPRVQDLFGASFDDASMRVSVSSGAVIAGASRVNSGTGDPLTLAASSSAGGSTSPDGTYQVVLYDSFGFGSGGNVVVSGGVVEQFNVTYVNFDKLVGADPACPLIFLFGGGFAPTPLADFASGVSWTDSFNPSAGGDNLAFTVTFTVQDNMTLVGTVDAVGSDFTGGDAGCNGAFPPLELRGGKDE